MFLVAITQAPIAPRLAPFRVEEIALSGLIATIVTDGVLSRAQATADGFSVVEAPAVSGGPTLAQVSYRRGDNLLELSKPTRSARPIYHHISRDGEFFASTHVALLRLAGVPLEERPDVLPELFVYRFVMAPNTLYRGIEQVPAGGRLEVESLGGRHRVRSHHAYALPSARRGAEDTEAIVRRTRDLLDSAMAAWRPAGERVVALLSGGMDSSVLFRLCQDHFRSARTYSAGFSFEHPGRNQEKEYALSAAEAFGARHTYLEPGVREYLHDFLDCVAAVEEPLHHLQTVLLHALFRRGLAADLDIVVSGVGTGLIFGHAFHRQLFAEDSRYRDLRHCRAARRALSMRPISALARGAARVTGHGRLFLDYMDETSPANRPLADPAHVIWSLERYGSPEWACEVLGVGPGDIIKHRAETLGSLDYASLLETVSQYQLLGDVLATQSIWSKVGEGAAKFLDFPFSDTEVLDHVAAIPWGTRLRSPNCILKAVARLLGVPDFILSRPKSSFGLAPDRWASPGGVFEPLVPLAARVMDEKHIRAAQNGEYLTGMTFWTILNYAVWRRLWIQGEPVERLHGELEEAIARG